jgi:hypothetical protein
VPGIGYDLGWAALLGEGRARHGPARRARPGFLEARYTRWISVWLAAWPW